MSRFEIKLLDVMVVEGQGLAEGDFELQVKAILHPGDKAISWPDIADAPKAYRKVPRNGGVIAIDRIVDTVEVTGNAKKTFTVDIRLTEVDEDFQGKDDWKNYSVEFELSENSGPVTVGPTVTLNRWSAKPKGRVKVRITARPV